MGSSKWLKISICPRKNAIRIIEARVPPATYARASFGGEICMMHGQNASAFFVRTLEHIRDSRGCAARANPNWRGDSLIDQRSMFIQCTFHDDTRIECPTGGEYRVRRTYLQR